MIIYGIILENKNDGSIIDKLTTYDKNQFVLWFSVLKKFMKKKIFYSKYNILFQIATVTPFYDLNNNINKALHHKHLFHHKKIYSVQHKTKKQNFLAQVFLHQQPNNDDSYLATAQNKQTKNKPPPPLQHINAKMISIEEQIIQT